MQEIVTQRGALDGRDRIDRDSLDAIEQLPVIGGVHDRSRHLAVALTLFVL